jgi:hypothetical protein
MRSNTEPAPSRLSARVRNNLEVVARTNTLKPDTIEISFDDSPAEQAEQRYYTHCLNRFALERAHEGNGQAPEASSATRPIGQPIRVTARPRERKAQRSSRTTSSSGDDPDEPPAPANRRAHHTNGRPAAVAISLREVHSRLIAVQITLDVAIRELPDTGAAENVQHAREAIARLLGSLEYFGIEVKS